MQHWHVEADVLGMDQTCGAGVPVLQASKYSGGGGGGGVVGAGVGV